MQLLPMLEKVGPPWWAVIAITDAVHESAASVWAALAMALLRAPVAQA